MAAPQVPAGPESQRSAPAEGAVGMSAGDPLKDIWGGKRGKYLPRPVCSWPLPQAGPGQGVNPWPPDWRQAVQMEVRDLFFSGKAKRGSPQGMRRDPTPRPPQIHPGAVCSVGRVRLFVTPWTVACQAPLPMGFSRHKHWSGLLFPSGGIFLTWGLNLHLLHCRQSLYCLSPRDTCS